MKLLTSSKRFAGFFLLLPALVLFILFFIIPTLILLSNSLFHFVPGGGIERTLTIENFLKFVKEPRYYGILFKTIWISLVVVVSSLIIGYPVAYFLARTRSRLRILWMTMLLMPILIGPVIRAYGWQVILGNVGLINTLLIKLHFIQEPIKLMFTSFGVIIALTQVVVVLMILPIMSVLKKIEPSLEEAAQDLGANKIKTFIQITLPLSLPGIAAGSSLAFALSLSAFVVPELIGGAVIGMMGVEAVKQIMSFLNWPFGAAISTILVLFTLVIMYFYEKLLYRTQMYSSEFK